VDLAAASLQPLPGGWSGQTFLADVAGERSVVRVYADAGHRGAAAAEVDAALLRLVRGLLPVPEVLELRHADPAAGMPALLVTSYLPGVRGDLLLPDLDAGGRRTLGAALGGLVADLGGMPQLRLGPFVDGDLRIGEWDLPDLEPVLGPLAARAQALLDTVTRRVLVHSDLNPKNLLVDPDTLVITGLVDWEYAHAGHPFTDLGNLLRFERDPVLTAAVLDAYVARRGGDPDRVLALARAADLPALADLAARRDENPVAARADRLLGLVIETGDPGAWDAGV